MAQIFANKLATQIKSAKRGSQARIEPTLRSHPRTAGYMDLEVRFHDMTFKAKSESIIRDEYAKYIQRSKASKKDRPIQIVSVDEAKKNIG